MTNVFFAAFASESLHSSLELASVPILVNYDGTVMTFSRFLNEQQEKIFSQPWPVLPSALVIAALNVFLFALDRPWTASEGLRNWGDAMLQSFGIFKQTDLLPPLLYSGSVLNLSLLFGALAAALLSREFALRSAPAAELAKGALGGLLMGVGAMLSFGCNIGGFFSALPALSLSGAGMMTGLALGAFIGTRYLIWENKRMISFGGVPFPSACAAPARPATSSLAFKAQPVCGALTLALLIGVGMIYQRLGHGRLGVFLFFGVALGFILQRSRFCLVNAFREPFMTGEGEHARAAAVALILGTVGFAILKAMDLKDATEWVFPSFWLGSVLGGSIFGIGMVLAGGCGAGSVWRAGEGHLKLWAALLAFAIAASLTRLFLVRADLIGHLGEPIFLPSVIGWTGALASIVLLMVSWYLISAWIEQHRGSGVLKL
jgi:hypothetical protein